jgi:hypothetical protein
MARPLKPLVCGGGYYPSKQWTPLVYNGGYTTMSGGNPPVPPASNKVGTAKVGTAKCA